MKTLARNPIVEGDLRAVGSSDLPWKLLRDRSVLVTGATGLVASSIVEAILYDNERNGANPCQVVALVRNKQKALERFAPYANRPDLTFLTQDVCEPVATDIEADYIVHAAGNATPQSFGADPVGTYKAATLGTHHLLEYAHSHRCQGFLLLSSGSVHGVVSGTTTVIDENVFGSLDPLASYACYAESKRMAETMCASWHRQYGVPARIARLGHTYGPGLRRSDDRAFAQFVYSIVDRKDIVLQSDGSAVRPYCYMSDAVAGLLRILLAGADGEAYMVADPDASCSILELARLLAGMYPDRGVNVRTSASLAGNAVVNKDPFRSLNVDKVIALGWKPAIDVETGFQRTLKSML